MIGRWTAAHSGWRAAAVGWGTAVRFGNECRCCHTAGCKTAAIAAEIVVDQIAVRIRGIRTQKDLPVGFSTRDRDIGHADVDHVTRLFLLAPLGGCGCSDGPGNHVEHAIPKPRRVVTRLLAEIGHWIQGSPAAIDHGTAVKAH